MFDSVKHLSKHSMEIKYTTSDRGRVITVHGYQELCSSSGVNLTYHVDLICFEGLHLNDVRLQAVQTLLTLPET